MLLLVRPHDWQHAAHLHNHNPRALCSIYCNDAFFNYGTFGMGIRRDIRYIPMTYRYFHPEDP